MTQTEPTNTRNDPILTTRAVAAQLGVSVSTAQQWIESGAIASWKTPGGHRRVRQSAVMALVKRADQRVLIGKPDMGCAVCADRDDFVIPVHSTYPTGPDEENRLKALDTSRLIDSPPEKAFDRLTWLATRIIGAPMAMISLLTARRQWFKSRVGLDVTETSREWAFCGHAILSQDPLIVPDATKDERFAANPLVTGHPFIRFYAGFPVKDKNDYRLGTLCVLDQGPRTLNEEQRIALLELAEVASEEIARRS